MITVKIMKVQITSLQEGMKYKSGKQLGDRHSGKYFLLNVNIYQENTVLISSLSSTKGFFFSVVFSVGSNFVHTAPSFRNSLFAKLHYFKTLIKCTKQSVLKCGTQTVQISPK